MRMSPVTTQTQTKTMSTSVSCLRKMSTGAKARSRPRPATTTYGCGGNVPDNGDRGNILIVKLRRISLPTSFRVLRPDLAQQQRDPDDRQRAGRRQRPRTAGCAARRRIPVELKGSSGHVAPVLPTSRAATAKTATTAGPIAQYLSLAGS